MRKVAAWTVNLRVNGQTVMTQTRRHAADVEDKATLAGATAVYCNQGDTIDLQFVIEPDDEAANQVAKRYAIDPKGAFLSAELLRWW